MLDAIRNNSQSWGVKLAFGIIIVVFVFWGFSSVGNMGHSTTVATVNDATITVTEFDRAYLRSYAEMRAQNPEITVEELKQLPAQILDSLIDEALLDAEVKRLQISIPDAMLRATMMQNPSFHNADGVFDPAVYKQVLQNEKMRPADFEFMVRKNLTINKLLRELTFTAQSYSSEVAAFFDYTYENRDVDYIFFPAETALAEVEAPAEDSIKAFYESNQPRFTLPAKVNVEYVAVYPKALGKPESITAEAVTAYYEKNKATAFTTPKEIEASHILLRLAPTASEEEVKKVTTALEALKKEIQDGADFAEVAKEHSEDPSTKENGGSLGFVGENKMVKTFNDALFKLSAGEVSDIVRTDFGLHLIKAGESKEGGIIPQAEAEKGIRDILAEEAGLPLVRGTLDTLIEANVLGDGLSAIAKNHGLEVKQTELKSVAELEKALLITPEQAAKILTLSANMPLDTAMETTDKGYIVARVKDKNEASVRPYEEVKEEIIAELKNKSALEKVTATATEARKGFDAKAPEEADIKTIAGVKRNAEAGPLGFNGLMSLALFNAKPGEWLPVPYAVSVDGKQGVALVRVKTINSAKEDDWKPLESVYTSVIQRQRHDAMLALFVASLRQGSSIEINNAYLQAVMNNIQ